MRILSFYGKVKLDVMVFQVFIRELISNASDALEKLRYLQMTDSEVKDPDIPLEIHIGVDENKKTFTIQVYR